MHLVKFVIRLSDGHEVVRGSIWKYLNDVSITRIISSISSSYLNFTIFQNNPCHLQELQLREGLEITPTNLNILVATTKRQYSGSYSRDKHVCSYQANYPANFFKHEKGKKLLLLRLRSIISNLVYRGVQQAWGLFSTLIQLVHKRVGLKMDLVKNGLY